MKTKTLVKAIYTEWENIKGDKATLETFLSNRLRVPKEQALQYIDKYVRKK